MNPFLRWGSHAANVGVGVSGLVLVWMIWGVTSEDPFAVVNHPAQPAWKSWHVVLSPFLTLFIGSLWAQHAWNYWRGAIQKGRRSGILLLVASVPMVISGVAIQGAFEKATRTAGLWVHVVSSGLWLVGMAAHVGVHWRRK